MWTSVVELMYLVFTRIDWLMIAYIALFSAFLSGLTALACSSTWVTSFIARFLIIHRSGVLTALAWLVPHEAAAVSAQVLCTPYNHAPCHFMQNHIRKVYACLAVTCHLHFWQNDRDLLRATAVARGWNGYRNKSQHRKSTLEKKILPPLQQGFELATFQSRVRRSNHWAIHAPRMKGESYCRRLRSWLLCLCDVLRALIDYLVCWFCTSAHGRVLFQIGLVEAVK